MSPRIVSVAINLLMFVAFSSASAEFSKTTHVYKSVDSIDVEADVYRENDRRPRPVLVWIHGGALIVGSRESVPRDLLDLAKDEGYVLVSLDYRLAPEVKAAAIKEDVVDAFRWIHRDGPKLFRADTSKIVVAGGSAGGYLTMLAGCSVEPRPTALVAYWGYGDVDGAWMTKPTDYYRYEIPVIPRDEALAALGGGVLTGTTGDVSRARGQFYRYLRQNGLWAKTVVGADPSREPEKFVPLCPIKIIPDDYPPILMIHGKSDTDVPYEKSLYFAKELKRRGLPHELVTVPAAGHGLSGGDPQLVHAAHERALEFIREVMQK